MGKFTKMAGCKPEGNRAVDVGYFLSNFAPPGTSFTIWKYGLVWRGGLDEA
jgi:hypothetical protein